MNLEELLMSIAPAVDAALGSFLDWVAQAGQVLGLYALVTKITEFFGELFAEWGWSII